MTEKSSGADPAFPSGSGDAMQWGMSKREHFAALLLAGLYSNPIYVEESRRSLARVAIHQADLLLQQLAETEKHDGEGE